MLDTTKIFLRKRKLLDFSFYNGINCTGSVWLLTRDINLNFNYININIMYSR